MSSHFIVFGMLILILLICIWTNAFFKQLLIFLQRYYEHNNKMQFSCGVIDDSLDLILYLTSHQQQVTLPYYGTKLTFIRRFLKRACIPFVHTSLYARAFFHKKWHLLTCELRQENLVICMQKNLFVISTHLYMHSILPHLVVRQQQVSHLYFLYICTSPVNTKRIGKTGPGPTAFTWQQELHTCFSYISYYVFCILNSIYDGNCLKKRLVEPHRQPFWMFYVTYRTWNLC